jgi:hypothetical protein
MIEQVADLRLVALNGDRDDIRRHLFAMVADADGDDAAETPTPALGARARTDPKSEARPRRAVGPLRADPSFEPGRTVVVAGLAAASPQESR